MSQFQAPDDAVAAEVDGLDPRAAGKGGRAEDEHVLVHDQVPGLAADHRGRGGGDSATASGI
jgi:hypothetical protein